VISFRRFAPLTALICLTACSPDPAPAPAPAPAVAPAPESVPAPPAPVSWAFEPAATFPADQSLARPEDGVLLTDGRLLVGDEVHGLRLLADDGSSRPFGGFAAAGYLHKPPTQEGGANGVALEADGNHVLVADILGGGIFRVAVDSETTDLVYQHDHGVNTAVADRAGGIWFTQSTANKQADGHAGIFSAVGAPKPDGMLFYLPPATGDTARIPILRAEGLLFANGIALDEANAAIYLAETMAHRLLRFRIDATGALTDRTVLAELVGPDNVELGPDGRLWVAQPISNQISVIDIASGETKVAFSIATPASLATLQQISERIPRGEGWMELLTPTLWEPAPGLMTGLILAPDGTPRYWTGLGKAIVRLDGESGGE